MKRNRKFRPRLQIRQEIDWRMIEKTNDLIRAKKLGLTLPKGGYTCLS